MADVGAAYIWSGGPTLTGPLGPAATLAVPGAVASDQLGYLTWQVADFTGDGALDLVGGSPFADVGGVANTGCLYLWRGGGLVGAVAPTVTWSVPGAAAGDGLGD